MNLQAVQCRLCGSYWVRSPRLDRCPNCRDANYRVLSAKHWYYEAVIQEAEERGYLDEGPRVVLS